MYLMYIIKTRCFCLLVVLWGIMIYWDQDLLIDNINEYLKKERMPAQLHLSEGGVCNGLVMKYAQGALQGAENEAEF